MIFINDVGIKDGHKVALYKCTFCNKETVKRKSSVKAGTVKSCGCMTHKIRAEKLTKHGLGRTKIYAVWAAMVNRCYNIDAQSYHLYGQRGISVCDEWKNDVICFKEWAFSNGYFEGLHIDRINNDGNYEPSNCQWISHKENSRNRRQSKLNQKQVNDIKIMLEKKISQCDIAKKYNIDASLVSKIKKGDRWF